MFGMTLSVKKMCWSKKFGITSGTILGTMHTTVWNDNVRENNVCDNNIQDNNGNVWDDNAWDKRTVRDPLGYNNISSEDSAQALDTCHCPPGQSVQWQSGVCINDKFCSQLVSCIVLWPVSSGGPIRGQHPGHVITRDQPEASIRCDQNYAGHQGEETKG